MTTDSGDRMQHTQELPAWLTIREAAAYLGVHRATVQRAIKEGRIPVSTTFPHDKTRRISREAVLAMARGEE